jgi:hypothetical protein
MRLIPLGSAVAVVTYGLLFGGTLSGAAVQHAVLAACTDAPVSAGDIAPAWTVASASLEAAASRPEESLELTGRTYIRDVTGDGAPLGREQTTSTFSARDLPIEPASAEVLATHGFGIRDGRDYVLIAPSPAALLSHWFLAAHCVVAVRRDSTAGLEALEFVPSSALGERVGLAGTMWIDLRAGTLTGIDFRYRNLSDAFIQQHASGKVEFSHHGVDNAFLARWWIRLPYRTAVVDPAGTRRPQRYLEQGGVTELAAEQASREQPAPPSMELPPSTEVVPLEPIPAAARAAQDERRLRSGSRLLIADEGTITEIAARGGRVAEVVRHLGGGFRIQTGVFHTLTAPAEMILCIEAGRGASRLALPPTRFSGRFCDMVAVYVDGVLINSGGAFLYNLGLDEIEGLELLSESEAVSRFGLSAGSGALAITTKRGPG